LFGASGIGGINIDQQDFPGSSYFIYNNNLSWFNSSFNGVRFVVKGETSTSTLIPEPNSILSLLALGAIGAISALKENKK
jgi:hypothetical protein